MCQLQDKLVECYLILLHRVWTVAASYSGLFYGWKFDNYKVTSVLTNGQSRRWLLQQNAKRRTNV